MHIDGLLLVVERYRKLLMHLEQSLKHLQLNA
jgi:hypothetical protein